MSGSRTACVACKTAKAKCDLARPSCGRCVQRGLVCSGLALDSIFTFRDENEVAKRNSQRARREQLPGASLPIQLRSDAGSLPGASTTPATISPRRDDLVSDVTDDNSSEQEYYWWLNTRTTSAIPEPLKRDVETRAVERFFVNWILYPSNHGTSPGYMSGLPALFSSSEPDSVLQLAVRAVAFADMRHETSGSGVPFHVKARQHYGAALNGMRAVIADGQEDLGSDSVLTAMLLVDNFELMYLGRSDPVGAHNEAIRHVLRSRGEMQLYTPSRFSLWQLTHYRLQAWQTMNREHPESQQVEWLDKLNMERPDLFICKHVLRMNVLSAVSRTLTQSITDEDVTVSDRAEKLDRARQLVQEMQEMTVTVENWATEMSRVWGNAREEDAAGIVAQGLRFPTPYFPYPRLITYDDIWLAYIWNFYAASQIVLRESLVEVIEYTVALQGDDSPTAEDKLAIQQQREWVNVLSAAILKSFPQLLGLVYRAEAPGRPYGVPQGRMAGRLFALFSMWVVQRARFTSPHDKQTASAVISWINARHELD